MCITIALQHSTMHNDYIYNHYIFFKIMLITKQQRLNSVKCRCMSITTRDHTWRLQMSYYDHT